MKLLDSLSFSLPAFDWFNDNKAFCDRFSFIHLTEEKTIPFQTNVCHVDQMNKCIGECVWDELISYTIKDFGSFFCCSEIGIKRKVCFFGSRTQQIIECSILIDLIFWRLSKPKKKEKNAFASHVSTSLDLGYVLIM